MMNENSDLFKNVRQELYNNFNSHADAIFNTIDSLSGRQKAESSAELSLEPLFQRGYSSLYKAIEAFFVASAPEKAVNERQTQSLKRIECLLPALPQPKRNPFRLTGVDATPAPRKYSKKLIDKGVTYYPNPAPSNKPIVVGHTFSLLVRFAYLKFSSAKYNLTI